MAAREPISLQLAAGLETGLEAWEILAGEVSAWCKMAQLHESSSAGSSRRLVRHAEASRLRSRISHLGPNWTGLYRPRFVRHRIACYAACAADESWLWRMAAGVW